MGNQHRGSVSLEVGEDIYKLRFSTNAICELEEHFGKPITEIVEDMQDDKAVTMGMVRALVWGALITAHPDMTKTRAGEIIDEAGMPVVMDKIGLAMQRFWPEGTADAPANPPKAKTGA